MPVIPSSAIGARFIGWGTALPEKVVTNEELEQPQVCRLSQAEKQSRWRALIRSR
jgi:3-oxoacyl-[acyl-carrier-protein] synthase III